MIKLKDDIRFIQFINTDESRQEIKDLLGMKYLEDRINPVANKASIIFMDEHSPTILGEILEGDYILLSNTNEILMILDKEYFNKIFEVK